MIFALIISDPLSLLGCPEGSEIAAGGGVGASAGGEDDVDAL
jgi:hypothetical protein